ncbi:hypothetical protein KFK09_003204 [Dendrobium nobile]|uniref:Uncharacterized protein n=1 Tax=Dendrobium nobile TaxID=94219 RepID=A0A8T3C621_DENNO|nr:hypothetical protein KFK09_003204 [Dendrobium nobile]
MHLESRPYASIPNDFPQYLRDDQTPLPCFSTQAGLQKRPQLRSFGFPFSVTRVSVAGSNTNPLPFPAT